MLRRLLFCAVCAFMTYTVSAQIRFDTVSTVPVGPGMVHHQIEAPAVPWTIDVLEIDLTNPYLEVRAVKSNGLRSSGYETPSEMAARLDAPGHRVVGAINGDFFTGGGETTNLHVGDGEIVRRERTNYPAAGFSIDNLAVISRPDVGGSVHLPSGNYAITGYNEPRGTDALVLYNRYMGSSTETNAFGTEVLVRPLGDWLVNDTLLAVVASVQNGIGNMALAPGEAVLSGHGAAATFLRNGAAVGDTIRIYQRVFPALPRLEDMVGGNPVLAVNGAPAPLDNSAFNTDRHPRTAVGFTADTTRYYFVTVDGRQTSSAGMTNFELRDFMLQIGAAHALNLDGGGSTAMVVRGDVVNSPSDGAGERPVANALLAISTAPTGPLGHIYLTPSSSRLFMGHTAQFQVRGADTFFNPLPIDPARVQYSVDPGLGTITPEGLFTAGTESDSGYVRVQYEGLTDSARIVVKTVAQIVLAPQDVVTDTARVITFTAHAFDQDGLSQTVPSSAYTWSTTDPEIGTVTEDGRFKGLQAGTTQVIAAYGSIRDTAEVTVETGVGIAVLDSMESLTGWTLTGTGIDLEATTLSLSEEVSSLGNSSIRIDYRFTADASTLGYIFLNTDIPVYGVPDSIFVDARTDGANHRIYFDIDEGSGAPYRVFAAKFANNETAFDVQPGSIARAAPMEGGVDFQFPIRLKSIMIQLGFLGGRENGKVYEGTIYLDNLRVSYPTRSATAIEEGTGTPASFALLDSVPNPFHTSADVRVAVARPQPLRLVLYDVLGRACQTVFDGTLTAGEHVVRLEAGGLASGIYFLRAESATARPLKVLLVR